LAEYIEIYMLRNHSLFFLNKRIVVSFHRDHRWIKNKKKKKKMNIDTHTRTEQEKDFAGLI